MNDSGYEVYLSTNTLKEDARSRTSEDIAARRALSRGESRESIIAAIASYRRFDKPHACEYARRTVEKASRSLEHHTECSRVSKFVFGCLKSGKTFCSKAVLRIFTKRDVLPDSLLVLCIVG
jgi:hypothetical protein